MKKATLAALLGALLSISACSQSTQTESSSTSGTSTPAAQPTQVEEGSAIAIVNNIAIPQSRQHVLLSEIQAANPGADIDVNEVKDNLITQEVLSQEASRLGLNQTEAFREQLAITERSLLVSLLYQDFISKNPVTEEQIAEEYNRMKALLGYEYLARHILVETEDQAKEIIEQLKNGGNFEALASEFSQDRGSATDGGSLGWAASNVFVPEFASALTNLEKGQFTQTPVQSQFGWHVILLEDTRDSSSDFPELNDGIRAQIASYLAQKLFMEYQQGLIERADIKLPEAR